MSTDIETASTTGATINKEHLSSHKPKAGYSPKGRQAGYDHLKPMDMEAFIVKHECINLLLEHPWIRQLKLVSNPYMYKSLGHANYKTGTVELSEKTMKEPNAIQREVFIRTVCHFIAKKLFDEAGEGQAYKLIVARFNKKARGQSNSTATIKAPEALETIQ